MRIKKLKAARKTLAFFRVHFKLRPPYKLVMDGCFLHNAHKREFAELIAKLLQAEIAIYLTHCVRHELEQLGDKVADTLAVARRLPVLKCGHKDSPLTAADCICKQVGNANPKKYIVASTDTALMDRLRGIPGLPLLYMDRSVMVLESPSAASREKADKAERLKNVPSKAERRMVQAATSKARPVPVGVAAAVLAAEAGGRPIPAGIAAARLKAAAAAAEGGGGGDGAAAAAGKPKQQQPKKVKGPRGVNPLAMKKKKKPQHPHKKKAPQQSPGGGGGSAAAGEPSKKRRRRKKHAAGGGGGGGGPSE